MRKADTFQEQLERRTTTRVQPSRETIIMTLKRTLRRAPNSKGTLALALDPQRARQRSHGLSCSKLFATIAKRPFPMLALTTLEHR